MFLVKIYDDNDRVADVTYRIADGEYSFTNAWTSGLRDIQGMSYSLDSPHGGMISSKFGILSVLPTVLADDYIGVDIYYSNTDEAGAKLLFSGVGYINSRTRSAFAYDLFTDVPNEPISEAGLALASTDVLTIFTNYFENTPIPDWSVDSTGYTATDKAVDIIGYGKGILYSEFLSDLCKTYGCYFVLDSLNKTVYLRDVNAGVGTTVELDEFLYYPSKYSYNIPVSRVRVGSPGDPSYAAAYQEPYYFGSDLTLTDFHTNSAPVGDLSQHLVDNARDLYINNAGKFDFFMPIEYFVDRDINFFTINKLRWTDTTVLFPGSDSFEMIVQNISFNMIDNKVTLSGYVSET